MTNYKPIRPLLPAEFNYQLVEQYSDNMTGVDRAIVVTNDDVDIDDGDVLFTVPEFFVDVYDDYKVVELSVDELHDGTLIDLAEQIIKIKTTVDTAAYLAGQAHGVIDGRQEVRDVLGITAIVKAFAECAVGIRSDYAERELKL